MPAAHPRPRLIAFLRALNVGGHNVTTMEKLRGLFEALGLKNVETFIASGNVIFTSPSGGIGTLQKRIEAHLRKSLGYEVHVFLRTESEVAAIARYKPFEESKLRSAVALNVGFLAEPLEAGATKAVMALKTEIDEFHVKGRELYWLCKKKQTESKVSKAHFEKALKVPVTFRGLKTIMRLATKCAG